ncbi:hypothetical protein K1719_010669 [Acacia pycnantha]|nr:hypothetical protein K1719_010669 [Acacia pycnantha]
MARTRNKSLQAKLESTIGAAFFTRVLSLNESTMKFDIWDTAAQERYHSLAPLYYRGGAASIVVYDITGIMARFLGPRAYYQATSLESVDEGETKDNKLSLVDSHQDLLSVLSNGEDQKQKFAG